jgi:uncharacterized protein YbaR (Trm112 family)
MEILVCPEDKKPLWLIDAPGEYCFYNPRLRKKYRITDDIPILLSEEAESLSPEEAEALDSLIERGYGTETAKADSSNTD